MKMFTIIFFLISFKLSSQSSISNEGVLVTNVFCDSIAVDGIILHTVNTKNMDDTLSFVILKNQNRFLLKKGEYDLTYILPNQEELRVNGVLIKQNKITFQDMHTSNCNLKKYKRGVFLRPRGKMRVK